MRHERKAEEEEEEEEVEEVVEEEEEEEERGASAETASTERETEPNSGAGSETRDQDARPGRETERGPTASSLECPFRSVSYRVRSIVRVRYIHRPCYARL